MKPNETFLIISEGFKKNDFTIVKRYIEEKTNSINKTTELAGFVASVVGAVYSYIGYVVVGSDGARLTNLEEKFVKNFSRKKEAEIDRRNILKISNVTFTTLVEKIWEKTKNISPIEKATLQSIIQHIKGLQRPIAKNLQKESSFPVSIRGEERSKTFS